MQTRTIQLLHVEDDLIQQKVVAHYLKKVADYTFDIHCVPSENEALEKFHQTSFDLVLLDYHLAEGNGLSCLKKLRQFDPIVPILAISGTASSEVAAELVHAGADDYFDKALLNGVDLARSVKLAVSRADAVKRHRPAVAGNGIDLSTRVQVAIRNSAGACLELRKNLEPLYELLTTAGIGPAEWADLYEQACRELPPISGQPDFQTLCRPVLLKVLYRLMDRNDFRVRGDS
jgi:CheY-like chemotaxis protein